MDKEMILSPGLCSHIKITTPNFKNVSQKSSNGLGSNSETVLRKGSSSPISVPASNSEEFPMLAGLTLQPEEEHSEAIIDTDWDTDGTGYGSDKSDPSEEPEEESEEESEYVKEWRRKLKYYDEMLRKTYEPQIEEGVECTKKSKTDDSSTEMSPEMKQMHHHNVLKEHFNEATREANIQGFVYGIVLQNNEVLSGSSDSLRKWWNETIMFQQSGPAAANQCFEETRKISTR